MGVEIYAAVLREGFRSFSPIQNLIAQSTALGWIFSGSCSDGTSRRAAALPKLPRVAAFSLVADEIGDLLTRFWEIEEVPTKKHLRPDDERCELLFTETLRRRPDGRYVVRLPLKTEPCSGMGFRRESAINSFLALMRRLDRDPTLAVEYDNFMREYERLGHMRLVPEDEVIADRVWYLPHHAVTQESQNRRKLRVVFDASRRAPGRGSLNDLLLAGPTLQRDLILVLLDWRQYRCVFTTDMVKMFRQILVAVEDQDLQRVIWKSKDRNEPRDYRLTTVTYGTSSAPFLAIRTLKQLVEDEGSRFPLGAHCITHQTYVDDVFSGADSVELAREIKTQLIGLLKSAGFQLDKWATNNPTILQEEEISEQSKDEDKPIEQDKTVKTLGLLWQPTSDAFRFNVRPSQLSRLQVTKREVLSDVARLFDPFGWLAPMTIRAKLLLQDLWILKLDWDSPLPGDLLDVWNHYRDDLNKLGGISIDRWLGPITSTNCELHGFADASQRAYAASVYLRTVNKDGEVRVKLLIAKTKMAPIKTISIPNLELCGSVLLVKLVNYIKKLQLLKDLPVTAWSDSRDVLAWIQSHPSRWKVFVANRVSYIQTELPNAIWKYVYTKDNPADLATRGMDASALTDKELWWLGPSWLQQTVDQWPEQPLIRRTEEPSKVTSLFVSQDRDIEDIFREHSSIHCLFRVVSYCIRFAENCRNKKNGLPLTQGFVTVPEIERARIKVTRIAQSSAFGQEKSLLEKNHPLPRSSPMRGLHPFVDKDGVIKVGGRLSNSRLSATAKHPPILPKGSYLGRLYAQEAHRLALHGGPTLTLGILTQMVWVIGAQGLVKKYVRNCMRCAKARPRLPSQLMGELPSARITPSRPFTVTGLDYAGPFNIRCAKGKGRSTYKGYIALFICFASKAIHLEAVGDMTTGSFLAALRRFFSRRGTCRTLYSDNGSNFKGADRELKEMFRSSSAFYGDIVKDLVIHRVTWTFIPPHSPHFGGLWEAGVKATKHHLTRAIGPNNLTFEEFSTVLAEIEACLNSRPLCPMTGNIDDINALTPAHILIGDSLGVIPEGPLEDIPLNRLDRFQLLTRTAKISGLVGLGNIYINCSKGVNGAVLKTIFR